MFLERAVLPCLEQVGGEVHRQRQPLPFRSHLSPCLSYSTSSVWNCFLLAQSTPNARFCLQNLVNPGCASRLSVGCDKAFWLQAAFLPKQLRAHSTGEERVAGRGSSVNIVVIYALKRAHVVPSHVLLAIMKCPVNVLMENCLLDTRKELHRASIAHLTGTHPGFLSACNGAKSFQTRDLVCECAMLTAGLDPVRDLEGEWTKWVLGRGDPRLTLLCPRYRHRLKPSPFLSQNSRMFFGWPGPNYFNIWEKLADVRSHQNTHSVYIFLFF